MFIETQTGRLINTSSLRSIEQLDNEIYGFMDNSTGGSVLIFQGRNEGETEDEFNRIKEVMNYYCLLIPREDDAHDDFASI